MATTTNDIVLIYMDRKPSIFARLEDISPDIKPDWWQVKLLVLTIPIQVMTWILEQDQINGKEFTMGGRPVRLEKIVCPEKEPEKGDGIERENDPDDGGKVIPLGKRR